jgi:DNA-binding XRE family transcriptional regulator
MNKIKQTLKDAGISQGEFGHLVGVSRVTVGWWCNDRHEPSKWIRPTVDRVLAGLTAAMHDGTLAALESCSSSAERLDLLRDMIASDPA